MIYAEVVNLVAKEDSINVSSETPDLEDFMPRTNIKVIIRENQYVSNITSIFANGKLETKAQIGLDLLFSPTDYFVEG